MMLREEELQEQILKDTRIIHFGTLSMTGKPVRSATRHAIETAKRQTGRCSPLTQT